MPAVLALLIVALSGCYLGNPAGPRVGMVGDSISALSEGDINTLVGQTYLYNERFVSGITIRRQLPSINQIANDSQGPPVEWVFELGTNDAGPAQTPTAISDFQSAMSAMVGSRCVVLIGLAPWLARSGSVYADLSTAEHSFAATHPNVMYVDNPIYNSPDYFQGDGIHPTAAGEAILAQTYRAALDNCSSRAAELSFQQRQAKEQLEPQVQAAERQEQSQAQAAFEAACSARHGRLDGSGSCTAGDADHPYRAVPLSPDSAFSISPSGGSNTASAGPA